MLDHVVANHDAVDAATLQRRLVDRALDDVEILPQLGIDVGRYDIVHTMRQFEHDDTGGAAFKHPQGLRAATAARIDNCLSPESIHRTECVAHRVLKPVQLEFDKVKVVPLVAERTHRFKHRRFDKPRDAIADRIGSAGRRFQHSGDDLAASDFAGLQFQGLAALWVAEIFQDLRMHGRVIDGFGMGEWALRAVI